MTPNLTESPALDASPAYEARATLKPVKRRGKAPLSPNDASEAVRVRRLREDAERPMSVNLAETIALSRALIQIAGAATHSK